MHSEVLVRASTSATVEVQLRFLHLKPVESGELSDERLVDLNFEVAGGRALQADFVFPGLITREGKEFAGEELVAENEQAQQEISGTVTMSCVRVAADCFKLAIDVDNQSTLPPDTASREHALLCSLLSAHLILTLTNGEFISLLDPPDQFSDTVKACHNVGNFPVLVGNEGEHDMMLCSPILLYDYPQIAPESAGDFFDSTEMDEMLTLRVMTLTDAEKHEMRFANDHARALLDRTERTAREQLQRTHGAIRTMRPVSEHNE